MKKVWLRVLSLSLSLLCLVGMVSSCAGAFPVTIAKDGESDYIIVYDVDDSAAAVAAEYLAKELEKLTGADITVEDDKSQEADKKVPEILVGRTNRGISYEPQRTLRQGEYRIAREGKNVYILGAGDGVLNKACDAFLEDVLDADFKVSGKGVLLETEGRHTVETVTLNGKSITDYTVLLPATASAVGWESWLPYVEKNVAATTDFLLSTATYDPGEKLPMSPAIVLNNEKEGLGEGEYRIEVSGEDIILSAGSKETAMALVIRLMEGLTPSGSEKNVSFELQTGGGKVGEQAMMPLTDGADLRVMCFNVYGNDEHKKLMPYVSASAYAYAADFICMQEYYEVACTTVDADLKEAGYQAVGTTFTAVSPTALEHKETDANYQKFAYVGSSSYTPIYYLADRWEVQDSGAYLFYWMNRYHASNTKSLAWGVFKNRSTGELVAVISTHFPLMTDAYRKTNKDGRDYAGLTDQRDGAKWRSAATQEILKQVEILRAQYPGILTVVGGDMNAVSTESCLKTMNDHNVLTNSYDLAPTDARTAGGSFHTYGKVPGNSRTAIDHWFVSDDVANVLMHRIVQDTLTVQGSDHCPVVVDIARK